MTYKEIYGNISLVHFYNNFIEHVEKAKRCGILL